MYAQAGCDVAHGPGIDVERRLQPARHLRIDDAKVTGFGEGPIDEHVYSVMAGWKPTRVLQVELRGCRAHVRDVLAGLADHLAVEAPLDRDGARPWFFGQDRHIERVVRLELRGVRADAVIG